MHYSHGMAFTAKQRVSSLEGEGWRYQRERFLTAEVEVAITLQGVSVPLAGSSQGSQVDGGARQGIEAARRLLNL